MKTVFEAYPEIEAYVLAHIDPVDLKGAIECYKATIMNDKYSLEYSHGCVPLSDKVEDLIHQWAQENGVEEATFYTPVPGKCWWMVRNVEGSFFNLVFRIYEKVLQTKNMI